MTGTSALCSTSSRPSDQVAVYVYTGKLGGGKTLCAVARIKEKLQEGCKVATNLDLNLVHMFGLNARDLDVIRLPDKPKIHDLHLIGYGNKTYDESRNGLLVLDECGTWFNSRNWNDKDRKPVNDWFLHARKLGWDVIIIIQDIKLLDSQARDAIAEHTAFCRRLDRVQVPLIGPLFKAITGLRLTGPKLHVARVVYGTAKDDLVADRHVYKGTALYQAYNTKQLFLADYPHGPFSYLTPWHVRGRYQVKHDGRFYMRMTRIYFKRLKAPLAMGLGAFLGVLLSSALMTNSDTAQANPVQAGADPDQEAAQVVTIDQEPEPETPIAEVFADYRVSAYMQSDHRAMVTLQAPDGANYTTAQLQDQGYLAYPMNNCTVAISRKQNPGDVHKILIPQCTVRPHNKPAYDLAQLPSVKRMAQVQF